MLSRRGWPNGADFCRWVDTGFIVLGCGGTRIFVLALVIAAASCHLETHHCKFLQGEERTMGDTLVISFRMI